MNPLALLNHLLNFAAPALALALLLPLAARLLDRFSGGKQVLAHVYIAQAAINFVVGVVTLAVGLWFYGNDGKMNTYATLVLVMASSQWVLMRA